MLRAQLVAVKQSNRESAAARDALDAAKAEEVKAEVEAAAAASGGEAVAAAAAGPSSNGSSASHSDSGDSGAVAARQQLSAVEARARAAIQVCVTPSSGKKIASEQRRVTARAAIQRAAIAEEERDAALTRASELHAETKVGPDPNRAGVDPKPRPTRMVNQPKLNQVATPVATLSRLSRDPRPSGDSITEHLAVCFERRCLSLGTTRRMDPSSNRSRDHRSHSHPAGRRPRSRPIALVLAPRQWRVAGRGGGWRARARARLSQVARSAMAAKDAEIEIERARSRRPLRCLSRVSLFSLRVSLCVSVSACLSDAAARSRLAATLLLQ